MGCTIRRKAQASRELVAGWSISIDPKRFLSDQTIVWAQKQAKILHRYAKNRIHLLNILNVSLNFKEYLTEVTKTNIQN